MAASTRCALLVSAVAALLGAAHCRRDTHATPPAPTDAPAASPSAVARAAPVVTDAAPAPPAFACGDAASVDVRDPKNVTDVSALAVAATRERAHVTFLVDGDNGCTHDGCYVMHQAAQVVFDASGRPSEVSSPRAAAVGISPTSDAVPFVMDGALFVLTQGHAGAVPMAMAGEDPADTIYVLRDGALLTRSSESFTGVYAAAGGGDFALALGVGQEWSWARPRTDDAQQPAPESARVLRVAHGGAVTSALLQKSPSNTAVDAIGGSFHSPAIVADTERAAVAFRRVRRATRASHLMVAWIDPRTGKALGAPVLVASGDVGAPALLLDGATLHVVWAARESDKAPYALRHATWTSGKAALDAPTDLATPTPTALSPSIAKIESGMLLAWMDAKDTRHGAIWAGHGATLEAAAQHAARTSSPDVSNARDPRWAAFGEGGALAWSEHDGPRRVRLAWCRTR